MLSKEEKAKVVFYNGKQYLNLDTIKGQKKVLVFTLDDGTMLTIKMLSEFLNCYPSCARARLTTSSDPSRVFAPVQKTNGRQRKNDESLGLINSHDWYKDPLTKLVLKNI
jgi:hypothetical protein